MVAVGALVVWATGAVVGAFVTVGRFGFRVTVGMGVGWVTFCEGGVARIVIGGKVLVGNTTAILVLVGFIDWLTVLVASRNSTAR